MIADGLSLKHSPYAAEVLAEYSPAADCPLLEDDVRLWVSHDAYQQVVRKTDALPHHPILEPADLWAPAGIVLYEGGFVADNPDAHVDLWLVAHQWWPTADGLAVVQFMGGPLRHYLSQRHGITGPYESIRSVNRNGPDRLVVDGFFPTGKLLEIEEQTEMRFVTPVADPMFTSYVSGVMWPWGSPITPVGPDYTYEISKEEAEKKSLLTGSIERAAPDMERAALRRQMSPFPVDKDATRVMGRLWTIMQTAAAPLSSLPRGFRRPLEREGKKKPAYRQALNSLWVVDVPQLIESNSKNTPPTNSGETGAKHSYRYPVRGHWRNQWYPSVQARKPIWIEEHIRGPVSAPLYDARSEWAKRFPVYRLRPPPEGNEPNGTRTESEAKKEHMRV